MKKQVLATLLCASILGGTFLTASSALAADGGVYDTGAVVTFEENDEPVTPVDPEDPEKPVNPINPIDPEIPVKPGTPGPLSIDYASNLNFGKQKISSVDKTYFAATQMIENEAGEVLERENYVQVTDNRGDALGWQLSAKQESQFKTTDGKELKGAKITFMNAQPETAMDSPQPSTIVQEFDLTSSGNGEAVNVYAAEAGEGAGTWIYRFGDATTKAESVKLDVPGKSTKLKDQTYSTKITWTLTDAPGNGGGEGEGEGVEL